MALSMLAGITVGGLAVQGLHAQSKPPAYVIAEIDVMDQDRYAKEYQSRAVKPIQEEGGGKFLSRGSKSISIRVNRRSELFCSFLKALTRRKPRLLLQATRKLTHMEKDTPNFASTR
jgi:hypothetical protein